MPRINRAELDELCRQAGVSDEVRTRLQQLCDEDATYGRLAKELELKPSSLRSMVSRIKQRVAAARWDAEGRELEFEAEILCSDREAAKDLRDLMETRHGGQPRPPLCPVSGDRDTIQARRVTLEDYETAIRAVRRKRNT
jgi:hypothetical protein